MKSSEIFQILELLLKKAKPTPDETKMSAHMINTLRAWEYVLRFYAKGNYDAGVTARKFLMEMQPGDEAIFKELDKSARVLARNENQSES